MKSKMAPRSSPSVIALPRSRKHEDLEDECAGMLSALALSGASLPQLAASQESYNSQNISAIEPLFQAFFLGSVMLRVRFRGRCRQDQHHTLSVPIANAPLQAIGGAVTIAPRRHNSAVTRYTPARRIHHVSPHPTACFISTMRSFTYTKALLRYVGEGFLSPYLSHPIPSLSPSNRWGSPYR